jgi:hypothetical protein
MGQSLLFFVRVSSKSCVACSIRQVANVFKLLVGRGILDYIHKFKLGMHYINSFFVFD